MARTHNQTGRSRRQLSSFVALERYLLKSPAWQSLSPVARSTFIELGILYDGSNNGRIAMSARTLAERLCISRATATRALAELTDKGFLDAVRMGGFNVKSGAKRATEWRMTCHRCDVTGEKPARTFMRWQAGRIHFTASHESHSGFTREPQSKAAQ